MPYVKQEVRERLDPEIKRLVRKIISEGKESLPGVLNYCITCIIINIVARFGKSYSLYNSIVGAMECAKIEFYRRWITPYEEEKIDSNGDVIAHHLV